MDGYATSGFCFMMACFDKMVSRVAGTGTHSFWFPVSVPRRYFPRYFQKEKSDIAGIWMRQTQRVTCKLHTGCVVVREQNVKGM